MSLRATTCFKTLVDGRAGAARAGLCEELECASEGGTCKCAGGKVVYGSHAQGKWSEPQTVKTSIDCTNRVFGDPAPGHGKVCMCVKEDNTKKKKSKKGKGQPAGRIKPRLQVAGAREGRARGPPRHPPSPHPVRSLLFLRVRYSNRVCLLF